MTAEKPGPRPYELGRLLIDVSTLLHVLADDIEKGDTEKLAGMVEKLRLLSEGCGNASLVVLKALVSRQATLEQEVMAKMKTLFPHQFN